MEFLLKWSKAIIAVGALIVVTCTAGVVIKNQQSINNEIRSENYFLKTQLQQVQNTQDTLQAKMKKLEETHPYTSKKWKSRKTGLCATGNFFGFLLYTPVDTSVCQDLIYVLSTYKGPEAKINSLRRHYNRSSEHYHGKAVDLAWNEEVISFLISEEGKVWLNTHNINLYIEGRPGSRRVKKYLSDPNASQYVFFNTSATGDHIHLNI